jgi:hypothetical protein
MGQAVVWMQTPSSALSVKRAELVCSTIEMAIVMLFNDVESLTVAQICDKLQIDEETCRKNVHCLNAPKSRILLMKKAIQQEEEASQDS